MKEIKLKTGGVAFVDDEDFDLLNQYVWYGIKTQANIYAVRALYDKTTNTVRHVRMHREVIGAVGRWNLVDHINHNKLDNRKENLRIVTQQQNLCNQRKKNGCKFPYKGVKATKSGKYSSMITHKGKGMDLGTFATIEEAAIAYNNAAIKIHGEYAHLNKI
jgi:hypothetical protein